MSPPPDFVLPDFDAPLDLGARLAAAPNHATLKGMFIQAVVDEARTVSGVAPGRGRYVAFKDYPLREWVAVLAESAQLVYPHVSPREAMRRLGQKAYPTFLDSTVGSVLMAVAGRDFVAAIGLVPRIYAVTSSVRAEIVALKEGRAEIRFTNVWDFPEAWQVGVLEGGLVAFGKKGEVRTRTRSISDVDFELVWASG